MKWRRRLAGIWLLGKKILCFWKLERKNDILLAMTIVTDLFGINLLGFLYEIVVPEGIIGCQHETVRKETILMYLNIPDFFIPCFSF